MRANAAHQATEMAAHFRARRRLAGPQQDRHRARGSGVVDVDRQKAALVIVRVEQRELMVVMNHIDGVVDVERDRFRRAGIAGAVDVDHGVGQGDHLAQVRGIFPA